MNTVIFILLIMLQSSSGWKPEMCRNAVEFATPKYIQYCIANSREYPSCSFNGHDPREAMWAAQGDPSHSAYFEVLDCSWHGGKNPRDIKINKKSKSREAHDAK